MIEMFLRNIFPGLPEQVVELCWPLNCSFLGHGTRYILQKSGEVYPDIRSRGHRTSNIHVRMFGAVRYFLNIEMFDVRMFACIQMFESSRKMFNVRLPLVLKVVVEVAEAKDVLVELVIVVMVEVIVAILKPLVVVFVSAMFVLV